VAEVYSLKLKVCGLEYRRRYLTFQHSKTLSSGEGPNLYSCTHQCETACCYSTFNLCSYDISLCFSANLIVISFA